MPQTRGKVWGKMAIGAIALTLLLLVAGYFLLFLYAPSCANMARVRAQVCRERLSVIYCALGVYQARFGGEYPLRLSDIINATDTGRLSCPDYRETPTAPAGVDNSYVYLRPVGPVTVPRPIVYCRAAHHLEGFILPGHYARNVLYTDGTVREEPASPPSVPGASGP